MKLKCLILLCILKSISCDDPEEDESRIVGGSPAFDGQAPYQCSMQTKDSNHFCGCAIISSQYALTAAHCLSVSAQSMQIRAGTNRYKSGGQVRNVERTIINPAFTYTNGHPLNDIGLIKIQNKFEFNNKVQAIKYGDKEVPPGTQLLITGWGRLSENSEKAENLQQLTVRSISLQECKKTFPGLNEGVLCTFNRAGQGTCQYDSGGPLVWSGTLVGLVSFGTPCAKGYPDAYTKVSYFANWIRSNTN